MPIRRYEVIGQRAAPKDFVDYAFEQYSNNRIMHIVARAKETPNDELAARRATPANVIEFDLQVMGVHGPNDNMVIEGPMYMNGQKESWTVIEVKETVEFTSSI